MKVQEVEFELESICPLKMDKWIDEQQPKNEEGFKKQAPKKVYTDAKGNLAIPASAVKAAMKFASSEIGKKMEAKKNRQTIKSGVFFPDEMLTILPKSNKPDSIVRDIVTRGQSDKVTRVAAYRPMIKSWKVAGKMLLYPTVPTDFAKNCIELAGIRFGLLSHRPEFGRFVLKKWEVANGTE